MSTVEDNPVNIGTCAHWPESIPSIGKDRYFGIWQGWRYNNNTFMKFESAGKYLSLLFALKSIVLQWVSSYAHLRNILQLTTQTGNFVISPKLMILEVWLTFHQQRWSSCVSTVSNCAQIPGLTYTSTATYSLGWKLSRQKRKDL